MKIDLSRIKSKTISVLLFKLFALMGLYLGNSFASDLKIYKWIDKDGRPHFGDRHTAIEDKQIYHQNSLSIIKLVPVKRTKTKNTYSSKRKIKNPKARQHSRCSGLNSKIASLERQLRVKQSASKFDANNENLSKLKWEKIKYC